MKAVIRKVKDHSIYYDSIAFVCPGCIEMIGGTGLHMLPVNTDKKKPAWTWDGNLLVPTVSPSILTKYPMGKDKEKVCHSFLKKGIFQYLNDCTHSMAGKEVPLPDLPDWFVEEDDDNTSEV